MGTEVDARDEVQPDPSLGLVVIAKEEAMGTLACRRDSAETQRWKINLELIQDLRLDQQIDVPSPVKGVFTTT
jgi:hypothetical protein